MPTQEQIQQIKQEAMQKYPIRMVQGEGGFGDEIDENKYEREAYKAGRLKSDEEKDKEIERLKFMEIVYLGENKQLRDKLLKLQKENNIDPYWYFPQCDVEGCESVSSDGGGCWRETGYWSVCPEHSRMWREGKPQPQMKQSAIDKEATRDKETGILPIT